MNPVFSILLGLLALGSGQVKAAGNTMDPNVRLHAGVTMTEGPAPLGLTLGMESRFTRFLYLDFGGVVNPMDVGVIGEDVSDSFSLRHCIYLLPGIRIPHRQPAAFLWDVNFRAGPGVLWTAFLGDTLNPAVNSDALDLDVAIVAGGDLALMKNQVGIRASGRLVFAWPFNLDVGNEVGYWVPLYALEGFYQF